VKSLSDEEYDIIFTAVLNEEWQGDVRVEETSDCSTSDQKYLDPVGGRCNGKEHLIL